MLRSFFGAEDQHNDEQQKDNMGNAHENLAGARQGTDGDGPAPLHDAGWFRFSG